MSDPLAEEPGKPGGAHLSEDSISRQADTSERPSGWRGIHSHPTVQVALLGVVCFMCPGMFNALSGLGGGGQVNAKDQANASSALYATFAFFGFFSGYVFFSPVFRSGGFFLTVELSTINNVLGARLNLMLGALGYPLYISAFLCVPVLIHRVPKFTATQSCKHSSKCWWICHCFGRCPGHMCGLAMDSTGFPHDGLPYRVSKGVVYWYFLGYLQLGRCGWFRRCLWTELQFNAKQRCV